MFDIGNLTFSLEFGRAIQTLIGWQEIESRNRQIRAWQFDNGRKINQGGVERGHKSNNIE